jgi:branched-chain amino acid transport system ATP-binding protein
MCGKRAESSPPEWIAGSVRPEAPEVTEGQVVCLLGRNGAGKTTTMRTIMGLTRATGGNIAFNDRALVSLEPYQIARLGIGFVPDDRLVFPDLTVRENLEIAARKGPGAARFDWNVEKIYDLFPTLRPLDRRIGAYLSGGEQQMLTVGRTLMGNPLLLLLDEPVEGVAPIVVQELSEKILKLKLMGLTILMAEQNLHFANRISDFAHVIDKGRIRYQGTMQALALNDEVKRKYLMI